MEFYIKKGKPFLFAHFSRGKVQKNIMFSDECDNKNFLSVFSSDRLHHLSHEKDEKLRTKSVDHIP